MLQHTVDRQINPFYDEGGRLETEELMHRQSMDSREKLDELERMALEALDDFWNDNDMVNLI